MISNPVDNTTSKKRNDSQHKGRKARLIMMATGALLPAFILATTGLVFEYLLKSYVFVSPITFIRPLIAFWGLLLILIWPIHKITGKWDWAGIALYVFVVVFYLSESLFYFISILTLALIILWAAISFLLKIKFKIKHIIAIQSALSTALLIILLFWLIPTFFQVDWASYQKTLPSYNTAVQLYPTKSTEKLPDIYFIILDGYADNETLQKYYQYDNSDFIEYLKEMGFTVPTKTYSNYAKTSTSIPTALNLDYIHNLVPGLKDSVFWWLMEPFIRESLVHSILEQAGYQSIAIATDWDITNNSIADIYYNPYAYHLTQFEGSLLDKTQLNTISPLLDNIAFVPSFKAHHELIQYNFETLTEIPQLSGQKFVFAHIITPHPPFIIDNDGQHTEPQYSFTFNDGDNFPGTSDEYKTGYLNKLEYTNAEMKKVIEAILAKSEIPPIILIQADHGPGLFTDFSSSENTCLEERFSIFSAYYLPNLDHNPIPEEFTPVNLFRIIFNEYFFTDLPLLENKSYFYFDTIKIFHTEDITMQLKDPSSDKGCIRRKTLE